MRSAPRRGSLPTALWLLRSGLHPVPTEPNEKRPIGKGWAKARPTREWLEALYGDHPGAGVGIALGPDAGVVDLEIDDPERAAPALAGIDFPPTLGWTSVRGTHRVFRWDDRLGRLGGAAVVYIAGGAAELRLGADGKQVMSVCPPTVGTDRRRRRWGGVWEIAPLPPQLIELCAAKEPANPRPPVALAADTNRYAAAALRAETELVRTAVPGARNRTLNRAAFNLGQLVGAGMLPRETVEAVLAEAAAAAGLRDPEVQATLKSGLAAGILRPRRT